MPAASILDALPGHAILTLDLDGNITSWNEGARRLTGYSDEDVRGRSYGIFSPTANAGELARMLQTALDRGSLRQERWWRQRDGGLVCVEEQIDPFEDSGFIVVTRNLSERSDGAERLVSQHHGENGAGSASALRSELQAAERRAAFLAEASSILVATSLDFDSTLKALARLAVSRLSDWCAIHSFDEAGALVRAEVSHRDPALEQPLGSIIDTALNERWQQTMRSVATTGQSHLEARLTPATWFDTEGLDPDVVEQLGSGSAIIAPLMGRGNVLGAVTLVMTDPDREYDDGDLALAEELGRRAAIALDNARLFREASEANRVKADFLAVMSHELRTPLNAIMGYTDLLDAGVSGDVNDKQRRQLDRIRVSARHLLQLIEEILSFARMEAGGEEVRLGMARVSEIVREAAAEIEPLAESKGLTFNVDIGEEATIETDAEKARQVLLNLLSNAVKFTQSGTVTLSVRIEDGRAHFDVIDTGIGIQPEELGHIYDPFRQLERPNTRRAGGTGLGLSVSRRYVRLLQGEIAVQSEPGRGTRFTVSLPLRITDAPARSG